MNLPNPEFEAEIYYLTPEEGGRSTAVLTGYRGQFYYDGRDWCARQEFIGKDTCELGDSVTVEMQTMSPIFHFGKLFVGKTFDIREGSRFVGRGTITQLLDERLQYWDYDTFFSLPHALPTHQSEVTELIAEIRGLLLSIDNQATIKCIQNLTKKEQMLTIECNLAVRQNCAVVDTLFPLWQSIFPYPRNLLKVSVSNNPAECELEFALDSRYCLTGKVYVFNRYNSVE